MRKKQRDGVSSPGHTREFVFCMLAIILVTFTWLAIKAYDPEKWDSEVAGQFGDFVGGYFGTVFLVISVGVLVGSYRNQRFTSRMAAFESRFFELLRYHRDNTLEIKIDGIEGRRAFVSFIREWRLVIELIRRTEKQIQICLPVRERAVLAYLAFFTGSGPNARRTFEDSAKRAGYSEELIYGVIEAMCQDWTLYKEQFKNNKEALPIAYVPFEGHHSRLAHYFRHLFHLVRYAANHSPRGTAKDYIDLVRAQLTTHEQAVLALHAASVDHSWREARYFEKYNLIDDIPIGFLKNDEFKLQDEFSRCQCDR